MVIIVADTTAGLPREVTTQLGIPLIPQIVIFGEDSYRDDTELDTATFLSKLRNSATLPKTAAPPPALYEPIITEAQESGNSVIVIAPSAKVSGTVRAATLAAQEHPEVDMRILDSQTVAANLGSLVLMAHKWAQQGENADTIMTRLEEITNRGRMYFMLNTLEYLQKGGRIGGAKALVGELLQIKPILTISDGQVMPFEQQRTKKRALARLVEIVGEQCPVTQDAYLTISQADAHSDAVFLANELRHKIGVENIPIFELPPAIVVHGGPGALAVGFFTAKA